MSPFRWMVTIAYTCACDSTLIMATPLLISRVILALAWTHQVIGQSNTLNPTSYFGLVGSPLTVQWTADTTGSNTVIGVLLKGPPFVGSSTIIKVGQSTSLVYPSQPPVNSIANCTAINNMLVFSCYLTFSQVVDAMTGQYSVVLASLSPDTTCATFSITAVVAPVNVTILGSPELTDIASTTFTCVAYQGKPYPLLQWILPGMTLAGGNQTTITGDKSIDGSTLTCLAATGGLFNISTSLILTVYYGPATIPTSSLSYPINSNVSLSCNLDSNPPITSYLWTRGGYTLSFVGQTYVVPASDGAWKPTVSTSTSFQCQGVNNKTQKYGTQTFSISWLATASTTASVPTPNGAGASTGSSTAASPLLGAGPIAGIVIACVVVLIVLGVVTFVCVRKRKRDSQPKDRSRRSPAANASGAPPGAYSFENPAAVTPKNSTNASGYKSPVSQPDVVRNSGVHLAQGQKSPPSPPPAYPGSADQIDDKPRSRKPIALYDMPAEETYPSQYNSSYLSSPKY